MQMKYHKSVDNVYKHYFKNCHSSYTQRDPPTVRCPAAMGETLGETVGEEREGTERNVASTFPVHLGTREPTGLLGLILCPWSLPPAAQSQSLTSTPPPRALPPNSRTPHSRGPPFHVLPLPFRAGPKQRPPTHA